ncbi:MAG: site-specific integrase [Pseudomonadota bacterium]
MTDDELARMAHVAGDDLSTATARAFHAFLFSIETGMRAGEVLGLTSGSVDQERQVARLQMTKNGASREVPLSSKVLGLWLALPGDGFELSSRQLDALFRKVRDKAAVEGLTYHDSRHSAVTRLARKLDVLTLARIIGHRDMKQLMTYYDEPAEEIAKRLDQLASISTRRILPAPTRDGQMAIQIPPISLRTSRRGLTRRSRTSPFRRAHPSPRAGIFLKFRSGKFQFSG